MSEINTGSLLANKYKILRLIGEGGMGVVWLAENIVTKENVALKVVKDKFRTKDFRKLLFFKKEADILQGLEHTQIGKLIEFDFSDSHFFIVMEYLEGITLQEHLHKNKTFTLNEFLDIAIQLSEIFSYIHSQNILHCDIKPNNIILQDSKQGIRVKILDFGIARLLPLEASAMTRSIGTCAYMSPEQSGFLRRKVDHRSDLYSLGIIFYHMLTGKLPYRGENIYKLMYHHISTEPESMLKLNEKIPPMLEKIILKLLSKDMEDRYSDGKVLSEDIKEIQKQIERSEPFQDFPLGRSLPPGNKYIPVPFTGREQELKKLNLCFDKARLKNGSILLVSGESGIGKTHLIEVFQEEVLKKEGIFISANNHELDRRKPYKSIVNCIDRFFEILSLFPENKKKLFIDNINLKLGHTGDLMINTLPAIRNYLTHTQKVEFLSDQAEKKRFDNLLIQTLLSMAGAAEGVVIFIDNIQWADLGTLQFIKNFIPFSSENNILLIISLRTPVSEKSEQWNLIKTIKDNIKTQTMILPPHTKKQIHQILSPIVRNDQEKLDFLCENISKQTGGNIQFVKEVLQYLNKKTMLSDDHKLDTKELSELWISDNQMDFISNAIIDFPEQIKALFSYMSVMGREVQLSDLFECFSNIDREDFIVAINKGTEEAVVHIKDNTISFSHGSFQHIFYMDLPEKKRAAIHEKVALFYENRGFKEDEVFRLAHHYGKSENQEKALYYLCLAGEKALQEKSYSDAFSCFQRAEDQINKNSLGKETEARVLKGMGIAHSYLGNNEAARKYIHKAISYIDDNLERSDLLQRSGDCLIDEGSYDQAVEELKKAYSYLGDSLPENLNSRIFSELLKHTLFNSTRKRFKLNQQCKDDVLLSKKLKILERLDFIGFWTGNSSMLLYNHFKSLNISNKLGPTPETLRVICVHMAILTSLPGPYWVYRSNVRRIYKYLRTGREVYNKIPDLRPSKLLFKAVEAATMLFTEGDIDSSLETIRSVMDTYWLERTTVFIQEITSICSQILEAANQFEELMILGERTEELGNIFENELFLTYAKTYKGMGLLYKGDVKKARKLLSEACDFYLSKNDKVFYVITGKYLIKTFYACGDFNEGRDFYIALLNFIKKNAMVHPSYCGIQAFFIESEIIRNIRKGFFNLEKDKEIGKALRELKKSARKFPFLHSSYLTNSMMVAFAKGHRATGERIFKEGEAYFRFRKEPFNKGIFYFAHSHFCTGSTHKEDLNKAYLLLHHSGAELESSLIEQQLEMEDPSLVSNNQNPYDFVSQDLKTTRELDLIIDIGKKIGTIHDIDTLLTEVLEQAVEMVGAEQGEIFLEKEDRLISISSKEGVSDSIIPTCKSVINMVHEKKKTIMIQNAAQDPVFQHDPDVLNYQLKSILCTPLISNDNFLGLIYLSNHQIGNLFSEHELELMDSLSGEAAIAIDNTLLLKETQELHTRMTHIINSIPSGIIAVDTEGRVLQYNKVIDDFLNPATISSDYEGKQYYWDLFPQIENSQPLFQRIVSLESQLEEMELNLEKRIYTLGFSPLIGESFNGAVIKLNEITEARKNQEHMIQVQKMETVSTLVGGMAHDFNNTLTGISASTNYLSNLFTSGKPPETQEVEESMITIDKAVKRASSLINQLLTFSMKKETEVIPIDILSIVDHAIKVSRRSFDKRISFDINLPDKEAVIMADPSQLEQVILNIMINASHAMTIMRNKTQDWGGTLALDLSTTKIREEKKLRILHLEDGEYWRLSISDTGIGMDKDTKNKIFEPFFTTKRTGEGTGLGLAMAYGIVRRLNGYLEVYSEPGKGSVFNLYFPLQNSKPVNLEKEEKELILKGEQTILIAEDESILRVAIARSLETCGFQVIQCENGRIALDYYRENSTEIDFVIMDMIMPEMTGQEAFYGMKEINPDVLVILTSGFKKDHRVEDLLANGVKYFLQKPYGKNDLFKYIQEVLDEGVLVP